jgi:hypothetical protein
MQTATEHQIETWNKERLEAVKVLHRFTELGVTAGVEQACNLHREIQRLKNRRDCWKRAATRWRSRFMRGVVRAR